MSSTRRARGLLFAPSFLLAAPALGAPPPPLTPTELCRMSTSPSPSSLRGTEAEGQAKDALTDAAKGLFFGWLKSRGGVLEGSVGVAEGIDNTVLEPIVEGLTNESAAESAAKKCLEGALKLSFPPLDVAITSGRVVYSGTAFAVDELYELTNPGYDLRLAKHLDFFQMPVLRSQGITESNLGKKVTSETKLRELWEKTYAWYLKDYMSRDEIQALLRDRWPALRHGWRQARAAELLREFHHELSARIRAENRRLAGTHREESAPAAGIYGLWQTASGSIAVVGQAGGSVEAVWCRVSEKTKAHGYKSGDRVFWGGRANAASADEGRTVIHAHAWSFTVGGDCPQLAKKDGGPYAAKLTYEPDADALRITEQPYKYDPNACKWSVVKGEPQTYRWTRVSP